MVKFERRGVVGGAVLLSGWLAGCAAPGGLGSSGSEEDVHITANLETLLRQSPDLAPPNQLWVATNHHVVYLSGFVATPLQSESAEALAHEIPGVLRVVNSIAVEQ